MQKLPIIRVVMSEGQKVDKHALGSVSGLFVYIEAGRVYLSSLSLPSKLFLLI